MEIKKVDHYFNLILDNFNFSLENRNFSQPSYAYILSDNFKNDKSDEESSFFSLNRDKIFASAGEYNLSSVYFWGLKNDKKIVYLFEAEEGSLLYWQGKLEQETLRNIKVLKKEIDVILNLNENDEEAVKTFKPKVMIYNKEPKNLPKNIEKQSGNSFKINLKKVNELILILK